MANVFCQNPGKSLLHSISGMCPGEPLYLRHVYFFVPCLILSFPGHSHAQYCFKMYAESTSKITSLFNILTGSLGQAEVVLMNHRGGIKSYRPTEIWVENEEMVLK